MKRIFTALASAVLVMLVTTGCMKLDMNLKVAGNDTVSGSVTMAFTKTLMDYAKQNGGDTSSLKSSELFAKQPGVTVKDYSDGEFEGTTYTFASVPLKKFAAKNDSTSLSIVRKGSDIVVSGSLDTSGGGEADFASIKNNPLTAPFFKNSAITVSIELPGEIKSTNGVRKGNKITWTGELGDNMTFEAVAYSPQGLDPVLVTVGVATAAVVAGGLVLFLRRKRKPLVSEAAE